LAEIISAEPLEDEMSRSGYTDECEGWSLIRWRGAVASAIRGKRGQAFLREALSALDALPEPELIPNDLAAEGSFCTLGAVGRSRSVDMSAVDPDDRETVAGLFAIPHALAAEIMWENDEGAWAGEETPRARWQRMRAWIAGHLNADAGRAALAEARG
jgi:hypothetical protein